MMQCPCHGLRGPTFICQHLQHGKGVGFNQPDEPPNSEFPFKNAWCNKCDQLLQKEGKWNDRSEKFAGILVICEGCFEEIKKRNESIQ